jgi:hypothetical protein
MNSTTLTGSCLCGSVKYSVTTEIKKFYFCHCAQCRKITGSSFASNILAKPSELTWVSGSEKVKRFDYPGKKSYSKVFCSECGSGLPFLNESGNTLFIPAGSLDSDLEIKPDNNIFWSDKASWYEDGIAATKCAEFPT